MLIPFNGRKTTSQGRNGYYACVGLVVDYHDLDNDQRRHTFCLEGLTSRGCTATGHLSVPVDEMPAVIAAMQELLHAYHQTQRTDYGYEPVVVVANRPNGRLIAALPCGREVHIHRDNDNIGTIIDVQNGRNAEDIESTSTFFDADNQYADEPETTATNG